MDGIYPEHAVSISDQTFAREVLNFPGPVVVYYWAPWCGYCQRLTPVLDRLASDYSGRLKFTKLVLDQNPSTGSQYGVQSVPTLLLFKGGKQVNRVVGALPKEEIERQLQVLL
jgi:thioredoxin